MTARRESTLTTVRTLYRWRGAEPPGGVRLTRLTAALPPAASASAASLERSEHLASYAFGFVHFDSRANSNLVFKRPFVLRVKTCGSTKSKNLCQGVLVEVHPGSRSLST